MERREEPASLDTERDREEHFTHDEGECTTPTQTLITEVIDFLEKNDKLLIETYVKYQLDAYAHMPTYTLTVLGKEITFPVDSGATHSVIKSDMSETPPKMSGGFVRSVGASGSTVVEKFSTPLISINQILFVWPIFTNHNLSHRALTGFDILCLSPSTRVRKNY